MYACTHACLIFQILKSKKGLKIFLGESKSITEKVLGGLRWGFRIYYTSVKKGNKSKVYTDFENRLLLGLLSLMKMKYQRKVSNIFATQSYMYVHTDRYLLMIEARLLI